MGALRNMFFGAVTLALAFSYQSYRDFTKPFPKPELGKTFPSMRVEFSNNLSRCTLQTFFLFFSFFDSDLKEYWGRGDIKNYKEDKTIKPFKISYSAEVGRNILLKHFPYFPQAFFPALVQGNKTLNRTTQRCPNAHGAARRYRI